MGPFNCPECKQSLDQKKMWQSRYKCPECSADLSELFVEESILTPPYDWDKVDAGEHSILKSELEQKETEPELDTGIISAVKAKRPWTDPWVLGRTIPVALLILAVLNMPPWYYYPVLRVVVSLTAAVAAYISLVTGLVRPMIVWGVLAIFYNPISPIFIFTRQTWVFIHLVSAILFMFLPYNGSSASLKRQ